MTACSVEGAFGTGILREAWTGHQSGIHLERCNGTGVSVENGRLISTGCELFQAAKAVNFSFAFALARCEGVNRLISVISAAGAGVNKSFRRRMD